MIDETRKDNRERTQGTRQDQKVPQAEEAGPRAQSPSLQRKLFGEGPGPKPRPRHMPSLQLPLAEAGRGTVVKAAVL